MMRNSVFSAFNFNLVSAIPWKILWRRSLSLFRERFQSFSKIGSIYDPCNESVVLAGALLYTKSLIELRMFSSITKCVESVHMFIWSHWCYKFYK